MRQSDTPDAFPNKTVWPGLENSSKSNPKTRQTGPGFFDTGLSEELHGDPTLERRTVFTASSYK